jgi:hypothetical protein
MGIFYYLETVKNRYGAHLVHLKNCRAFPSEGHRRFLGTFYTKNMALQQSKKFYDNVAFCENCLED